MITCERLRITAGIPWLTLAIPAILLAVVAAWTPEHSGSTANLRGIHNAGRGVAWASGPSGTLLRSEDDGFVWQQCTTPADARKLDFRGIWAWDANHAVAMSSGPGDASRLYETADGGAHWRLLFKDPDPDGFWDALVFSGRLNGILLGDPVGGRFCIWRTSDGGKNWTRDPSASLAALPGEGAFAASNSALTIAPGGDTYFATGGKSGARIFRLGKNRNEWVAIRGLLTAPAESEGVFSLAFRDPQHGVAVGGDYKRPDEKGNTAAYTSDGGSTWHPSIRLPSGYRSAVGWDPRSRAWIAAGPNGSDLSRDDGQTWKPLDKEGWNALSLPWAAGPDGRIAQINRYVLRH